MDSWIGYGGCGTEVVIEPIVKDGSVGMIVGVIVHLERSCYVSEGHLGAYGDCQ